MFFTVLIGSIVVFISFIAIVLIVKAWNWIELHFFTEVESKSCSEHRELYSRRIGWHLSRVNDETENGMYL